MTKMLLAQFADAERLTSAARAARRKNYSLIDAFTPFPVEDVAELLEMRPSRIRLAMLIGGLAMAAFAYGLEYYSAVVDYPYNSGGRPLDSWPTFMLVPFATGILVASVCGCIAFLTETGLPRLHHPLFDLDGSERVNQDAFVLAFAAPETPHDQQELTGWLRQLDAQIVGRAEP